MSQLVLQGREDPSDFLSLPAQSPARTRPPPSPAQDSSTVGRVQNSFPSGTTSQLSTPTASRFLRKPAPSPLQTTTAVSPPSSASSPRQNLPSPLYGLYAPASPSQPVAAVAYEASDLASNETSYYRSDSSRETTPDARAPQTAPSVSSQPPDDRDSASSPPLNSKPPASSTSGLSSTMASRGETMGAPRTASVDSSMSITSLHKALEDNTDIGGLIKTAGSAEAVIQYLLKEKRSQAQQNSQLWRLVDKQRAMILGLNKDLERALKDKEKYRKKVRELAEDAPLLPTAHTSAPARKSPRIELDLVPRGQEAHVPGSPGLDLDSPKQSPIDVTMAPYPITPPADQIQAAYAAAPSTVGELLDPSHAMPKASEHALDRYDHDAEERAVDAARKEADDAKEMPFNLGLPASRVAPTDAPRMPPPMPPPRIPAPSPPKHTSETTEGIAQFPAPPAVSQGRKGPPAPLRLRDMAEDSPTVRLDDQSESESDFDDILEVAELDERRGRRRTRHEDDRDRAVLAQKEAEIRSLSKKSRKSQSQSGTPGPETKSQEVPLEARIDQDLSSLAGMLDLRAPPPMPAVGLPASPRSAMSSMTSPPMSPMGLPGLPSMPLSPRPPRQPIPLPPNTPIHTPSPPGEALPLASPRPLHILKQTDLTRPDSSGKSSVQSPGERTRIYKGLVTEEYPDLLLPPNALPSIDIKVASSRMKPSRASLISLTQLEEDPVFTLAIMSRSEGGELWRVEKDTSSLVKLDQRLKQYPAFTAKTPDRSLFTGHAPAKLDARRIVLNQYFEELLETPLDTTTALELCKFLSHNTLPPNADETGGSLHEAGVDAPLRTGPGGRPFRTGYLTKRGKNFGGWKARFFMLEGPQLKYYETPGGAHLGTIKLQKAQIGKQAHNSGDNQSPNSGPPSDDTDNQYRHAFLILEPKKKDPNSLTKHVLCAESDRERDQWVDTLLRWIDYKEGEDDDVKAGQSTDRQAPSGSERGKKKGHNHGKQVQSQQSHASNESDATLIGVSYEATRQGDTPQGANGRHPPHEQHETQHSSYQSLAISGPRDPQVISASESWGSKLGMGLAPPNMEEKKARKRSFFGFGSKARSSSDGQESLFGSETGSTASGPTANTGPVRQAFGASLAEAVRFTPPLDVRVPLPAVVYRCIQYLDAKNAISEEGIFRLSGSNVVIKQLRERFNVEGDINLLVDETYYDIHAVASLLKLYLRELPTTILTRDLHLEFLQVTEMTDPSEKIAALSELVLRLPQANATLLKYLIAFLIKIINNAAVNKMTVRNVGIVFSPTLNIPAPVFAMFLQNYEPIFGIDPCEYELPSLADDNSERRPSLPTDRPSFGERRPSDTQRPSTAGNGSSPHRQGLMSSQGARSTPTPPPMNMQQMAQMNAMRITPTPPPQRAVNYEPQYLAQQSAASGNRMSMRPSYETNFSAPPNFDPTQMYPQNGRGAAPTYDRPIYENANAYQEPYSNTKAARRESTMMLGNLAHQGSKSRLREESRF